MNNAAQNTIKIVLGGIWLAVIGYYFYFQNHPYYLESLTYLDRVIPALLIIAIITTALLGAQHLLKSTKINLWKVLLTFFLLTIGSLWIAEVYADLALYQGGTIIQDELGWGVLPEGGELEEGMSLVLDNDTIISESSSFISLMPEEIADNFKKTTLLSIIKTTVPKLFFVLLFLSLLTLVAYSIGHKILKPKKGLEGFLLSVGLGLGIYMGIMFVLGLVGLIYLGVVVGIAAILTAIAWEDAWDIIKTVTTGSFKATPDPKSLSFWVVLSAVLVFVHNAIGLVRPMPIGWDDTNYYLYIPERIASIHKLIEGAGGMYNWELINTIASFSENAILPMFTNFWGGILAVLALYVVLNVFLSKKSSVTLASIFYLFPAVIFQASTDAKNDLALLFFILLMAFALIKWFKKDKKSWLYLAAIFAGISIGIKTTAILAVVIAIGAIVYKLFGRKQAASIIFLILAALFYMTGNGNLYLREIVSAETITNIKTVILIVAVLQTIIVFFKTKITKKALKQIGAFFLIISLLIVPWIIKSNVIDGLEVNRNT